jgi:peptidoglycan/LPS O-acetylase OafA/YrhL
MKALASMQSGDAYAFPTMTGRRFITLDAMRGVAAISVMMFHYLLYTQYHIFDHAYYAVDFFFVLSGVVLTHAYVTRIRSGMHFAEYMKARAVRLYPLYAVGLLIGVTLLPSYLSLSYIAGFHRSDYLVSVICNALFMPFPNQAAVPFVVDQPMIGAIFPFNIPAWSLFYEMLASVALFVAIRQRIRPEYVAGVSLLGLIGVYLHYKTLNVGWTGTMIPAGLVRTAFGFFLGVLLYKSFNLMKKPQIALHPSILLALTFAILMLPVSDLPVRFVSGTMALVLIPVLIWLGLSVNDAVEQRGIFIWLGRISYGVYAIHFPIYRLVIFALAGTSLEQDIQKAPLLLACVLGVIVIAAAHLITSVVDEPLRRWWLSIHVVRPAI